MLKIKDNIDLKELENFGFYLEGNTYKYNLPLGKCAYVCKISKKKELIFPCYNLRRYQFIFKNKIIREIDKIQNDLIKADLVEKVGETACENELEEAIKRLRLLLQDDCTCEECMKNKEAYKVALHVLQNSIPKEKIEDLKKEYECKYKIHKKASDKQFKEVGTRNCFDNDLAIKDLGAIRVLEKLLEE